MHTLNVRITHHKADVATLELFSFPSIEQGLKEIISIDSIKECVIIQTCNRVEIFAACEDVDRAYHDLMDYMMSRAVNKIKAEHKGAEDLAQKIIEKSKNIHDAVEVDTHSSALYHLLRLTTGLDSMIIGEDQILGQVKDAFDLACKVGTTGTFFKSIFTKAINVGKLARTKTRINEGAVSIGSAAVELAERVLGGLKEKNCLIIGAGEMAHLIGKSLKERNISKLLIANRTYERGVMLAREIGTGEVIKFGELRDYLKKTDLIISATSAPHYIITKRLLENSIDKKKKLVIIDVAIPRDVEEKVRELENVYLFNIDSLREIAEENKKKRMREAAKVERIIENELSDLIKKIYKCSIEDVVKLIYKNAEEIRKAELKRALRMLGKTSPREKEIIDDLTRVIISKTLFPIVRNLRKAVENGDKDRIRLVRELFSKN